MSLRRSGQPARRPYAPRPRACGFARCRRSHASFPPDATLPPADAAATDDGFEDDGPAYAGSDAGVDAPPDAPARCPGEAGALDVCFADGGIFTLHLPQQFVQLGALGRDAQGHILAAAGVNPSGAIRLDDDGHLDPSFGDGGLVLAAYYEDGGELSMVPDFITEEDGGRILAAGNIILSETSVLTIF